MASECGRTADERAKYCRDNAAALRGLRRSGLSVLEIADRIGWPAGTSVRPLRAAVEDIPFGGGDGDAVPVAGLRSGRVKFWGRAW